MRACMRGGKGKKVAIKVRVDTYLGRVHMGMARRETYIPYKTLGWQPGRCCM